MEVALGGTFDPIHDGHRALFERAFELGHVTVGLTSDALAQETRQVPRPVRQFDERRAAVESALEPLADAQDRSFEVQRLDDPTGIATEPRFDAIVVSPETRDGADRINELRRSRGLDPLDVEVVDHVPAADGDRISSTRIVRGEIDAHGNLTPERSPETE